MITRRTVTRERSAHSACRPLLIGIALGIGLVSASAAHASTFRVYTSSTSAMLINANDGYCSLAEAVQHVNGTNTVNYCTDFAQGSAEHRIELLQATGKPYASYHYKITALTITSTKRVSIAGFGAFIDSTGTSAFKIQPGAAAFFDRMTLTNTAGSAGGRLLENYGTLQIYALKITQGDVTGSQHPTGRGGGIFNAGTITLAENSLITANKAKKGGGIYNDSGIIYELAVIISDNTATLAGGGIYNISNSLDPGRPTNGTIEAADLSAIAGLSVTGNKARTGGGIFNRAWIDLTLSTVSGNSTTTSGSSGETCTGSASCDGLGGGVLNAHLSGGSVTRFNLTESAFENNTASARGGAIYNVGVLELGSNTINGNRASDGAAVYVTGPTDGAQQYCHIFGEPGLVATINNNCIVVNGACSNSTAFFSILSGSTGGRSDFRGCSFGGSPPTYLTATGNSTPFCQSAVIDSNSRCPQP